MADIYTPESYREWGDILDKEEARCIAERRRDWVETSFLEFAARSYQRLAELAFYCDPDKCDDPFSSYKEWRATKRRFVSGAAMSRREEIDTLVNIENSKWFDVDVRTGGHGPKGTPKPRRQRTVLVDGVRTKLEYA